MTNLSVPPNLDLVEPIDPNMPWVATIGESTPLRITPVLAKVLMWYKDGKVVPIAEYVGIKLEDEQLNEAIEVLKKFNLLINDDSVAVEQGVRSRLRFNSLFSIQFAVFNCSKHFTWLEKFANRTFLVIMASLNILFAGFGLFMIGFQWNVFYDALTSPQPPVDILLLFVFLVASVSLHEFAHGVVLTYFGGKVRRMGIMLFYLSPAFFCDVTDAWKLPNKYQRSIVALAGVNVTFGIAGLTTIAYIMTNQPKQWVAIASLALYIGSVLNLIPFIKLDGYIALMTYLDIPNMRARSMDEWKKAVAAILSGKWKALAQFRLLTVLFGIVASVTPILILVILADSLAESRSGLLVSILGSVILIGAILLIVRGIYRVTIARVPGESVGAVARFWIAMISIATTFVMTMIPVPISSVGAYWKSGNELVTSLHTPSANDFRVTLYRDGLFASKPLGTAVVTNQILTTDMPIQALSPNIKVDSFSIRKQARRMISYEGLPISQSGTVVYEAGSAPLWYLIIDDITLGVASDFFNISL